MADITEAQLRAYIEDEQIMLWSDLVEAINYAHNHIWSMACGSVAHRVLEAARLVGPTSPGTIPWTLHAGGVYAAILAVGNVPIPETSNKEWARLDKMMTPHGGSRDSLLEKFRSTCNAIAEPREAAFIRGER